MSWPKYIKKKPPDEPPFCTSKYNRVQCVRSAGHPGLHRAMVVRGGWDDQMADAFQVPDFPLSKPSDPV